MKVSKNSFKTLKNFFYRNPVILFLTVVLLTLNLFDGCEYEYVKPVFVDTTKVISFENDIVPILNIKCSTTGCHSSTSKIANLDLSQANAYQQITSKALIDTLNPETSSFYKKISAGGSMNDKSTPELNNNILLWIKQGAKNN